MSANQPTSFRFPFTLDKSVHPTVHTAVRYIFSGILDAQNAISSLNTKLGDAVTSLTNQIKGISMTPAPATRPTGGVNDVTGATAASAGARAGTAYTTRASDHQGLIVASGGTVTLNSGVPRPYVTRIVNTGSSATIVTPDQSRTNDATGIQSINGSQTYALQPGQAQNFYFNTLNSDWTAA